MRYLFALLIALWAAPLWAQDTSPEAPAPEEVKAEAPLFEGQAKWDELATRVEAAVATGRASTFVLAELRDELADWRDIFQDRRGENSQRIATVEGQLAALGAVPEDGSTEDPRIAQLRTELEDQLNGLKLPGVVASESYAQADGLIREIDSAIRSRQSARFTEHVGSPLSPTLWASTGSALTASLRATRAEVATAMASPNRQQDFTSIAPAVLALLCVGLVLVLRSGAWVNKLTARLGRWTIRGQGVWAFLLSLGHIVLAVVGLSALCIALDLTGMLGRRLGAVVGAIPALGLFPILANWLAGRLLPDGVEPDAHPMGLDRDTSRITGRRFVGLGFASFFFGLSLVVAEVAALEPAQTGVLIFPFGLILAVALYRLGLILRSGPSDDDGPSGFRQAVRALVSRGLMVTAIAGAIFAALGYVNGFEMITLPATQTIYVLGILLLLQRLSVDILAFFTGDTDGPQAGSAGALIPVFVGFALVLLAIPVLAVIWGVQATDISEIWARIGEGFAIGETRISPTSFLLFAAVFVGGYMATRLLQGALRSTVLPRTKLDLGAQNALVSGTGYIGLFLAALIAITTAGIDLSGLAIVAGALSVGIGFGLQNIVSNFISGIILLIERPISQGDWIEVNGEMGYVRDISVRSTRIETFDRTDVIVPNADLISGQVTNWTRGNSVGRVIVPVGVAYGNDTDRIASILQEIAEAHPMVLLNPRPSVVFQGFGADSLDFEIRAILRDVNYVLSVKSEMNHAIAKRFAEEEIEIPFGQRDIWLRNPEALAASLQAPAKKGTPS